MKKRLLIMIFPIIAIILELLPFSFPFVSVSYPYTRHKTATSYWAPFYVINAVAPITLILTGVLIISVIICVFVLKKRKRFLFNVSAAAAIMSLLAMIYSICAWIDKFTVISVVIFLLLVGECLLIYFSYEKNK